MSGNEDAELPFVVRLVNRIQLRFLDQKQIRRLKVEPSVTQQVQVTSGIVPSE